MCQMLLKHLMFLISPKLTTLEGMGYHYLHFTGE